MDTTEHPRTTPTTIPPEHNGPPGSGHGGVAAGRLAPLVDPRRAVVRLHAPIPLATPLEPVVGPDGAVDVVVDGQRVASVRPLAEPLGVTLDPVPRSLVAAAADGWLAGEPHPFPTCFGCGDARTEPGLGLQPAAIAGHDVHAALWTAPAGDVVPPWLIWAAIDCPSGIPAMAAAGRVVTGELAVEVLASLPGGAEAQIVSRITGRSGRKVRTEAAVLDAQGGTVAVARATWFALDGDAVA